MSRGKDMMEPGSSGSLKRSSKTSLSNHPEPRKGHCFEGILDNLVKKRGSHEA